MAASTKWKRFWEQQDNPLHRDDTKEYYRNYCRELSILFGGHKPNAVLDLGCGNGALYEHLGFNSVQWYKGVDFSESMLAKFRETYPQVSLECGDASSYRDEATYDLIFSNGVIQYFNHKMLSNHFENAAMMLAEKGLLVCASIPWSAIRTEYFRGGAIRDCPTRNNRILVAALEINDTFRKKGMGFWYSLEEIRSCAQMYGMSVKFYGSMHYMYRFHAVLMKSQLA